MGRKRIEPNRYLTAKEGRPKPAKVTTQFLARRVVDNQTYWEQQQILSNKGVGDWAQRSRPAYTAFH